MKAIDLFCGAGGASKGLADAGFTVTGVDLEWQKNYPYTIQVRDVFSLTPQELGQYDFIWASPPCQRFSAMTKRWGRQGNHPDLITPVREILKKTGRPYCIENVPGAPLINPVMLCGSMFNLQTKHGSQLRRHRLFECNFTVKQPQCRHKTGSVIGVYGGGQHPERRKLPATIGVYGNSGGSSSRDGISFFTTQDRRDAMGIQWMAGKQLSQAIPPAYSKYIAEHVPKRN